MNIDIVDRMKQIEIQDEEIQRRKRELGTSRSLIILSFSTIYIVIYIWQLFLDARIKAPADAEKYKSEILASANKKRAILEAEAQAEAIALKGDAEAFSVEVKAKAEAEGMAQKADAFKDYSKAAKVVERILIINYIAIVQIDLSFRSTFTCKQCQKWLQR